jgi:hypothetical protein
MFGRLVIVDNKDASPQQRKMYNAVCVLNEFGKYETLLMTNSELARMRERSLRNPEDTVTLSSLKRGLLFVLRLFLIL